MAHKVLEQTRDLLEQERDLSAPVLSLYLNIDQGWERNLNGRYATVLRNMLREKGEHLPAPVDRAWYERAADHAMSCVERHAPRGRTLVAFADPDRGLEWARTMAVPCEETVCVGPRPAVRRLEGAKDAFAPCLAILTDREHSRVFVLEVGCADGPVEMAAEMAVDRPSAAGTDQLYSQKRFQRRADVHAREHLEEVLERAAELVADRDCESIVLAGTVEAVTEIEALMSEPLKALVAGRATLDVNVSDHALIEPIRKVVADYERAAENRALDDLVTRAAKDDRAVVGLAETVAAATQHRVQELVISEVGAVAENGGTERARRELPKALQPWAQSQDDISELLVQETLLAGGEIETFHGGASEELRGRAQGAGAFLRF